MPTTLPRVNVPFERAVYEALEEIARAEGTSLSQTVARLVQSALELAEDLALGETAQERIKTFQRDNTLDTKELLRWNRARRKRT